MLRRITLAIVAAAIVAAIVPAGAAASPRWLKDRYSAHWHACLNEKACDPGRNIRRWGVRRKHGARQARDRDYYRSLSQIKRLRHPLLVGGPPAQAPGGIPTARPAASSGLESIAACESGGDPGAVSPNGLYRGKYQFDRQTWASVGGSGDPAAAPESEQDYRAAVLMQRRGSSPWPVCGG